MRIFLVLICSLAVALVNASAQGPSPTKEKKKAAPTGQAQPGKPAAKPVQTGKPAGPPGRPAEVGKAKGTAKPTEATKPAQVGKAKGTAKPTEAGQPAEVGKAKGAGKAMTYGKPTEVGKAKGPGKPTPVGKAAGAGKAKTTGKPTEVGQPTKAGKPTETGTAATAGKTAATGARTAGKTIKPQHFDLPKQPNTAKAPPVTFQQGRHIEGSQNWQGQQYTVFRNYKSEWHDQGWWHSHYNNIVFVFGAPYYWNAGYWFPAWGYAPNAYYAWDGPIYAGNAGSSLPPDQVIANVQATLQQQGYYQGEVDGLLGPLTRDAIAGYQRDHGLYETSSIDQPTLESLGMA